MHAAATSWRSRASESGKSHSADILSIDITVLVTTLKSEAGDMDPSKGRRFMHRLRTALLRELLAAISLAVLVAPAVAASDKQRQEAEALLARARELSNIRCEGCPSFKMKARAMLFLPGKGVAEGSYELVWSSPDSWSDTLNLQGIRQTRVRAQESLWQRRSSKALPSGSFRTLQLLSFVERLRTFHAERKVKIATHGRSHLECVCLGGKGALDRLVCISDTGFLGGEAFEGTFPWRYEFAHYDKFGLKHFPRVMRAFVGQDLLVEVAVLSLEAHPEAEKTNFLPPEGAESYPACDDLETAQPRKQPIGKLLKEASAKDFNHSVAVFGVVEPDGSVNPLGVVRAPSQGLHEVAMQTVREWKFAPARCGGVPARQEVLLEIWIGPNPPVVIHPFAESVGPIFTSGDLLLFP